MAWVLLRYNCQFVPKLDAVLIARREKLRWL